MFGVLLYAEMPTIVTCGIQTILTSTDDIDPCTLCSSEEKLQSYMKTEKFQILVMLLKDTMNSDGQYLFIKKIRSLYNRVRIIAIAPKASKDMVFRTVKSGANGFLSTDTSAQELKEAIYTIRGGHEYFSSSITSLLVSDYVEAMRKEPYGQVKDVEMLGKREVEVLSLWGEGYTNVEIADRLFISVRTVESHKNHIMQKLGIRTTVDLLKFAIRNNIVSI